MPIYEYQCEKCDYNFDKLQKMSDNPLKDCPECHAPSLKKMMSAPNFKLSGTGWYETDFKTKKKDDVSKEGKRAEAPAKSTTPVAKSD
jgi:putative FmdB family regulatory protein